MSNNDCKSWSRALTLPTLLKICPACGHKMRVMYYNQRNVVTLRGLLKLRLQIRRCCNQCCSRCNKPYRPELETRIALPHSKFGLDVLVRVANLTRDDCDIREIHRHLRGNSVTISLRSVANLVSCYHELLHRPSATNAFSAESTGNQPYIILDVYHIRDSVETYPQSTTQSTRAHLRHLRRRLHEQGVRPEMNYMPGSAGAQVFVACRDMLSGRVFYITDSVDDAIGIDSHITKFCPDAIKGVVSNDDGTITDLKNDFFGGLSQHLPHLYGKSSQCRVCRFSIMSRSTNADIHGLADYLRKIVDAQHLN